MATYSETMRRLMHVQHDFFGRVWAGAQDLPVHPRQGPLLTMLLRAEGATQSDVWHRFHVSPATVAVSVARLEKLGFLRREPSPEDGRANRLYLTPEGRDIALKLDQALQRVEKEAFDGFTQEELQTLDGYLRRIQQRLQAEIPKEQKQCRK